MPRNPIIPLAWLLVCASLSAFGKAEAEAFQWPPLPDAAAREAAAALETDGGLVVLERHTKVNLRLFDPWEPDIQVDDFVRFLVVSPEGIRNATVPVELNEGFVLQRIEGRTLSPEGTLTVLDEKKDVERTDVRRFGEKESLQTFATAHFPAPAVGSVLDLHFVATSEGVHFSYAMPLLYNLTTMVRGEVEVAGSLGWNILTFGDAKGVVKLEGRGERLFAVHVGTYEVETREKDAPPPSQTSPMLLYYTDASGIKFKPEPSKVIASKLAVDSRWLVQGLAFPPGDPVTEWWVGTLKEQRKLSREFMKRSGKAESVDVASVAPPGLPLEERLAKLYRVAQATVRQNPFAKDVLCINDLLSEGANTTWQGTLFFANLLDRAGISYSLGIVADREALRFSPLIRSTEVYSFATAVVIPRAGRPPMVLTPGDYCLPFGALSFPRQEALVLWLEGQDAVRWAYSPQDPPEVDSSVLRHALEMDASGAAKGTVLLSERGAKCEGFRRWYVGRELRAKSPDRDKKGDKSETERMQELGDEMKKWFRSPGEQFTFSGHELIRCGQNSEEPLEIKVQAHGKNVGQANGERWLVLANPLMAGYSNPYVRPARRYAIWNPTGGMRVLEGELLLPAGAKVIELPEPQEVRGPEGLVARSAVEAVEREGRVLLKSRLEYRLPLVLGSELYETYRRYLDAVTKMGQDRCIVQLATEKELE